MCLTLPRTLITLAGIEKVVPRFQDLEVMLQLLARSATGERMNPYTSLWTGVTPGDGPQNFHVVLLDNGRSSILGRKTERQTLRCIRCAACMNTCPVYRQTGGHAYGSVYPGPIGAILTPQLEQLKHAQSLPFASSLCGACYEVCPVKINIPEVLIDLRAQVTDQERQHGGQVFRSHVSGMRVANLIFSRAWLFHLAQWAGRIGAEVLYAQRWMDSLAAQRGREVDADAGFARAAEADVSRVVERQGAREQGSEGAREREGTMSAVTDGRKQVLERIRAATAGSAARNGTETAAEGAEGHLEIPRDYVRRGDMTVRARQERFIERLREYDAEVVECEPDGLAAAITAQLAASGRRQICCAAGNPGRMVC